ncbi:A disintegrin and metalloproteinase with thrombospondin motifs 1-like [Diadema antillarum]|uniref:A disintegrin and metalloproteinase with thrombospondin motifs 1-like n=1 Tax=Diadema antillarum TaxID=105358 RepID=UPI003A86E506
MYTRTPIADAFLTDDELEHYIGSERGLLDFHIAEPTEVGASSTSDGPYHNTDGTDRVSRKPRQASSAKNLRQIEFKAFDATYQMVLRGASGLIRQGLEAEFLGPDGRVVDRKAIDAECFYHGQLISPERWGDRNSTVAISLCSGVTGIISTPEFDLVVRPLKRDHTTRYHSDRGQPWRDTGLVRSDTGQFQPHIIIKRDSDETEPDDLDVDGINVEVGFDDEEEHFCGLDTSFFHTIFNHTMPLQSRQTDNPTRKRRETNKEAKAMELLVVADNQMRLYYGTDVVPYTLTLINIAAGRFRHDSLGRVIHFHIVRLLVLTSDSVVAPEGVTLDVVLDGEMTLSSFCWFQYYTNKLDDSHKDHWDNAIMITRYDIELEQNKYLLGIANVRGTCSLTHQCSLNEDNGLSTGLIIAHEIGHTLGMLHDKDVGCPLGTNIMSANRIGGTGGFVWSECSKDQLEIFLKYPSIDCLDDIPEDLVIIDGNPLPGQIYDADQQCITFSTYFSGMCTDVALLIYGVQDRCPQMYCRFPNGLCSRTGVASADGTNCGAGKWCIEGACVEKPAMVIDGGWSAWDGSWGACSRTCGGGVRLRHRYCTNPIPQNGGAGCEGDSIVAEMCNTQECESTQSAFRDEQCGMTSSEPSTGENLEWKAYNENSEGDQLCEMWCQAEVVADVDQSLRIVERRGDKFVDGTRCSVDFGETRVCVQGTCRAFGCDGYQYSGVALDPCGVCGGDSSTCRLVSASLHINLADQQFSPFLTIPAGVTSITVANSNNATFMWVTINGQLVVGGESQTRSLDGEYRDQNTTVYYTTSAGLEKIEVRGPTEYDIEFKVFAQGTGSVFSSIHYEYYVQVDAKLTSSTPTPTPTETDLYIWAKSEGECSVTCGTGTRMEVVRCVDVISVLFVDDSLCDLASRPVPLVESCELDNCPPRWFLADLNSTCSATCGEGVRTRVVVCLQFGIDGVRVVSDVFCNDDDKPSAAEPCTGLPDCPGTWVLSAWSPCKPCMNRTRLVLCRTGEDFLTELDDSQCPEPKPATWEECECVATTTAVTRTGPTTTTLTGGDAPSSEANPTLAPDGNFLTTEAEGTIDRVGSTGGALTSIVIVAPLGHVISVTFKVVKVICPLGDSFRVKDGENVYSACSFFTNFNWTSSSNIVQFDLLTNGEDRGYSLSYQFIQSVVPYSSCDQLHLQSSGVVTSPNYPSYYPPNHECVFYIIAPPQNRINLYFDEFDLHVDDAISCSTVRDHVQVKDMDQRYYSSIYCGQHAPFGYVSFGNRLRISFFSDSVYSSLGFSATYTFVD